MALHRGNLAPTTHSLTPRPPNRPLKIAKLTPCKKPEVAGSAGHCEPGVGRFTDPHPFTCSFFTPYLHCLMFRQYRLPQPSPIQPLSGVKFRFSSGPSRASLRCLCRPAWVSFFFFCLSPVSLSHLFLSGDETSFLSPRVGRCSPIRSQLAHATPTGPVTRLAGVASLPRPLTGHESSHRGESCFPPRTNSPLPLKGEGRDFAHLWGFGFSLAVAFGNRWPQLAHTGPTGRVCCFSGVVSLPGPQNRTQGHTGVSLVFTVFSWYASFAAAPPAGAPGSS